MGNFTSSLQSLSSFATASGELGIYGRDGSTGDGQSVPDLQAKVSTYLDELPEEVCERIACFLPPAQHPLSALSLAESSDKQGRAVRSALSRKLVLGDEDLVSRWAALFCGSIREICINANKTNLGKSRQVAMLLQAPTLERASIPATPVLLRAIESAPALSKLILDLKYLGRGSNGVPLLLQTLSSLGLAELGLRCSSPRRRNCVLADMESQADPGALANACPYVGSLDVQCKCYGGTTLSFLSAFGHLNQLSLRFVPAHDIFDMADRFNSICLDCVPHAARVAPMLGPRLTCLMQMYLQLVTEDEVGALADCPNLQTLQLSFEDGAEQALPDVVIGMPNLCELQLSWEGRGATYDAASYYSVPVGTLTRIIEGTTNVKVLHIRNVRVGGDELVEVLRIVGESLEQFVTSISNQAEAPQARLALLLEAASVHNRKLTGFYVFDLLDAATNENRNQNTVIQDGPGMARLRRALGMLRRRAPLLETGSLEKYLDRIVCRTADMSGVNSAP